MLMIDAYSGSIGSGINQRITDRQISDFSGIRFRELSVLAGFNTGDISNLSKHTIHVSFLLTKQ